MKNGIWIIVICLSACAWTPKDEVWKVSLETDAPEGIDGNCLPVAQVLQAKFGGNIAVISHTRYPDSSHAVLVLDNGTILDNGTVGYQSNWKKIEDDNWKLEYWWEEP